MQHVSLRHHAIIKRELDERDPSLMTLPIPAPSVPVLSSVLSPIMGGGNVGGASSASSSSTSPTASPTATSGGGTSGGSGSGNGGGNGNGSGNGNGVGNGNGSGSGGGGSTTGTGSTATTVPAPGSSFMALASSTPLSASTGPSLPPPGGIPGQGNSNGGPLQNIQGTSTMQSPSSTANSKASAGVVPQSSNTYAGIGSSPSDSSISTATAAATAHQLSSGAITGIVLACLFFLIGLVVVLIRRRSIARRIKRREQWWFGRNKTPSSFSVIGISIRDSQGRGAPSPNRASARSSFATNFDQGLMFRVDSPTSYHNVDHAAFGAIPELPPMAEVRERTSFLFPSAGAVARRESINSMTSNGSDPHSQYLVVPNNFDLPEVSSPMSVRPFSPSESFAFPKPPLCTEEKASTSVTTGSNGHGHTAPSSSAVALIQIHSPPPTFNSDLPPSTPVASYLQPPPSTSLSSLTATPNTSSNPFADPAAKPEFYDLKTIYRPFTPTLDDELSVSVGDKICVLKVFDDGWAFVEKQGSSLDCNESGLIPVDCLREAGQVLPAFLAQKRVSSYGDDANQLVQMLASSLPSK